MTKEELQKANTISDKIDEIDHLFREINEDIGRPIYLMIGPERGTGGVEVSGKVQEDIIKILEMYKADLVSELEKI